MESVESCSRKLREGNVFLLYTALALVTDDPEFVIRKRRRVR